jgi:maltooligosyltrehalose trehalohydrolase
VVDPGSFRWGDAGWHGIGLKDYVIYELHTGTFTGEGTFEAIIPFIGYLRDELGINAVELMPVGQFPAGATGVRRRRLLCPPETYGGPRGLKTLVNALHSAGMAAILDVVYNHAGPEGNYLGSSARTSQTGTGRLGGRHSTTTGRSRTG